MWKLLRTQFFMRTGDSKFGNQLMKHLRVVRVLESLAADEVVALGLAQGEFQFVRAIGGIEVYEHRADLRRCELREDPGHAIRGPDADAVAFLDAQRHERARDLIHFRLKPGVREAPVLKRRNQRLLIREVGGNVIEEVTYRFGKEWTRSKA